MNQTSQALDGLHLTIPLTKLDVERRLVIGRAAQEIPDKAREIMDYESAKPAFMEWSKGFESASGGLSKGNLRVMHTRTVAGKVVDLQFNDTEKSVEVVAHVVDPVEWDKCLKGVYTGFSIGGGYAAKWKDGDLTRYTPRIAELSLVDSPCMPSARFAELVKADGATEQLELRGRGAMTFAEIQAARPRTFAALRKVQMEPQAEAPALTFGELRKAGWDGSKHPREHDGKFASKTGEIAGRFAVGAAGAVGGFVLGQKYGPLLGREIGSRAGRLYAQMTLPKPASGMGAIRRVLDVEETQMVGRKMGGRVGERYGAAAGAAGVGFGGYVVGGAGGAAVDEKMRRGRAEKAGKLEQYERLNADVSPTKFTRKQAKAAAKDAMRAGRKVQSAYDTLASFGG